MTACNTQHLNLSFKELLQQFYDAAEDEYRQSLADEVFAIDREPSPRVNEIANQLFKVRLATQGVTDAK